MRILVLGGYGLIGLSILRRLHAAGHDVVGLGRDAERGRRLFPRAEWISADIATLSSASDWRPLIAGVDVVVNASGALQDSSRDRLRAVQDDAIRALIDACEVGDPSRFIQISAPGANPEAASAFLATKGAADDRLRRSALRWNILRPGLVLAPETYGGTALLRALAAIPLILPAVYPRSPVQTVWIGDVVGAVELLLENTQLAGRTDDLMHRDRHSLIELLARFRAWLGLPPARARIALPNIIAHSVSVIADLGGRLGWRSPLRSTAMRIMRGGVTGDADAWQTDTGMVLKSLDESLASMPATRQDRHFARMQLLLPLIVVVLALFWTISGVLGLARMDAAASVIQPALGGLAEWTVALGSVADIVIGLAFLHRRLLPWAALGAVSVSAAYLVGATLLAPALWFDPLGPLVKVVPAMVLALTALALSEER